MTKSWSVTSGDEHGELVAGELGELGPLRQHGLDAITDLDQQPVPGHRAERVVDLLEGHQVQEHQGHAQARCRGRPGWPSRGAPGASCGSAAPSPGRAAPGTPSPARRAAAWRRAGRWRGPRWRGWPSVSKSRRSSSTNELTSVSRLATTIAPTVRPSVVSGTIAASFTPTSPNHPGSGCPGSKSRDVSSGRSSARSAASSVGEMLVRVDRHRLAITRRVAGALGRTGGSRRAPARRAGSRGRRARPPAPAPSSSRAAERPGEVVQRLEVLVALGEPREGAVEHEQHARRRRRRASRGRTRPRGSPRGRCRASVFAMATRPPDEQGPAMTHPATGEAAEDRDRERHRAVPRPGSAAEGAARR